MLFQTEGLFHVTLNWLAPVLKLQFFQGRFGDILVLMVEKLVILPMVYF